MIRRVFPTLTLGFAALFPRAGWACAACYGQSDSPMAAGMNWGIVSLLGMIVVVLGGVAGFFIFLARRSATLAERNGDAPSMPVPAASESISTQNAGESQAELLAARGGFRRVSALVQRRQRCGRPQSEAGPQVIPRSRS